MDRNLDAFLAVARTGSLTQACDQLRVTQPSITKRIANLEEEFGAALFERHRRGMTLTSAGRVFLEHAKRIDTEYRHSREKVAAIGAAGISVLRVGAGPLFHLLYVAPLFKALSEAFPELSMELLTDANVRTIPMLMDGELDVVLGVIDPHVLDESIFVRRLAFVEHGIVLRRDDPSAKLPRVDPARFSDRKWVIYTDDPETEKTIGQYYLPLGLEQPEVSVRTTSFSTGLQLVSQGNFVMSAPLQLARTIEAQGLVIRPSHRGMPRREAGIHIRKSSLGFAAIQVLLETLDKLDIPSGSAASRDSD